ENGEVLDDAEFIVASAQLLVAGHESTTNLIGNAVFHLLEHPTELERLRRDPALVDSAIEEVLRFDSPVQGAWRRATRDVTVAGCPVAAESRLYLLFGSANRDPALHADPDRFDIGRFARAGRHFSFGHGLHVCLGAALARREARIALQVLLARLPNLRLDRGRPATRSQCHFLRGFRDLPVRWDG
ncbi:MAG TPA: cytochrome P450, partial [Nevskiaceae bacterium]|nr:cytochrome P450 [Nevskiaceae bacterium]